ncbi:MAG: transcriptional regulator BetI [Hyphomicrobiales bacterium]|nr:transcriptional regulator BetI [Hyphomicrobiales bacterium]
MPKLGMEPIRRQALIEATIETIGAVGSLDVTVRDIAERAGVSAALAHHYFGNKEELFLATMRALLARLAAALRQDLVRTRTPRDRVSAVIAACFASEQFEPATIAAWLVFYVKAQSTPAARRLLRIYARRLDSNLRHALKQIAAPQDAARIADGAAAMIDGLWLRHALKDGTPDPAAAAALVEDFIDDALDALELEPGS